MSKCLILLTNITPLEKGEAFVKNEIPFLSDAFDRVLVLALQKTQGELINNNFPENVDVFEVSHSNEKTEKLKSKIFGSLSLLKPTEIMKNELKVIENNFKRSAFLGYFENRSKIKFNQCLPILNSYDFSHYDEVVIYSFWFFLPCRVGIEIKNYLNNKNIKTSFISRAHGYDLYEYVNALNYLPEREFLAENADLILPCSMNGAEHLEAIIPEYKNKIHCHYLGSYDNGLSSYSSTFHIVTCSRSTGVKRLDKLIDALSSLKNEAIEIYWTHIGDGELQEKIKALAKDKLHFMDFEFLGQMDNNQVMDYYSSHPVNLFVNVSSSEGLPVSIMEATSFGIPVLATDVGGTHEIIKDNFNGKLISKDFTDDEFKNALLEIYNLEKADYEKLRFNARAFWAQNFDAQKNYTEFSNLIKNLEPIVK